MSVGKLEGIRHCDLYGSLVMNAITSNHGLFLSTLKFFLWTESVDKSKEFRSWYFRLRFQIRTYIIQRRRTITGTARAFFSWGGGVGFSLVNPPRQEKPLTERWQIERKNRGLKAFLPCTGHLLLIWMEAVQENASNRSENYYWMDGRGGGRGNHIRQCKKQ